MMPVDSASGGGFMKGDEIPREGQSISAEKAIVMVKAEIPAQPSGANLRG